MSNSDRQRRLEKATKAFTKRAVEASRTKKIRNTALIPGQDVTPANIGVGGDLLVTVRCKRCGTAVAWVLRRKGHMVLKARGGFAILGEHPHHRFAFGCHAGAPRSEAVLLRTAVDAIQNGHQTIRV